MAGAVLIAALAWLLVVGVPAGSGAATETELQSAIFRARLPGTMVAVRCR